MAESGRWQFIRESVFLNMNSANSVTPLLLICLVCLACADDPNTVYDETELPFTIQRVGLGSTEQDLLENLGTPISQEQQPPQFGEREIGYSYQGLYVHVTDGIVEGFRLRDGPFEYDNGISMDMTKAEVASILGKSYESDQVFLSLGQSDCHVILRFSDGRLRETDLKCWG